MAQDTIYPVYLIAGFLDSGKTSFINGILSDGFAMEDRTMLLCCEEGEEEYDRKLLRNVTVVTVDDQESLTPEFLEAQRRKCRASQIIVEYNGMWQIQDFYVNAMPQSWALYQIIATVEGPTFDMYGEAAQCGYDSHQPLHRPAVRLPAAEEPAPCQPPGGDLPGEERRLQRELYGRHGVRL